MKSIAEVINETIPFATRTVLQQNRINLSEHSVDRKEFDLIVFIGFSGEGFLGTLGFAAEQSILKADYDESETNLSDGWLGEIANQLLGRLKNSFLAYGIEIYMQIPKILHGIKLTVGHDTNQVKHFMYNSKYGRCCTWVDASWDFTQNLQLAEVEEHAQTEGETILF